MDSQPQNVRVKELETAVDDLLSELEVKSKDMDTLRNEYKAVRDRLIQLKRKHDQKEDDSAMLSKPTASDSLKHEVSSRLTINEVVNTQLCSPVCVKS